MKTYSQEIAEMYKDVDVTELQRIRLAYEHQANEALKAVEVLADLVEERRAARQQLADDVINVLEVTRPVLDSETFENVLDAVIRAGYTKEV